MSGTVLWRFRCGVYADNKTKGLKGEFKGRPPRQAHRGGMEWQLMKLRNSTHPKTRAWLPHPVELDPIVLPASNTADEVEYKVPDGFYVYVPAALPTCDLV